MNKALIRKEIRKRKALLSESEQQQAANRVFATLQALPAFVQAKHVLLYHSLPDELSTHEFLSKLPKGKKYYLPRVKGDDIEVVPYNAKKLRIGAFNIAEPDGQPIEDVAVLNLIVVPGVAFDKYGNRVGRGKGYYDRLLGKIDNTTTTIGVCYECQLVDKIDTDAFDIPMHIIIADQQGIIRHS